MMRSCLDLIDSQMHLQVVLVLSVTATKTCYTDEANLHDFHLAPTHSVLNQGKISRGQGCPPLP